MRYDDAVNLAFGTRTSLLDLVAEMEALSGRPAKLNFVDERIGDVRDSQADGSRLQALFPGIVAQTLTAGLEATIDWFATGSDTVSGELSTHPREADGVYDKSDNALGDHARATRVSVGFRLRGRAPLLARYLGGRHRAQRGCPGWGC